MSTSTTSLSSSTTSGCCPPVCCFPLPQSQPGQPGPPGPPGPPGHPGALAFDSFRCLCVAQLQNFLNAFVECVPNADTRRIFFGFVAGPANLREGFIRADIDYRNRILIPFFNQPPSGQPPDMFINLFNVALIFPELPLTEDQLSCIYNNMRNNNPAGQFQLGGCEAQINRQLVNRLRALQGQRVDILVAEVEASGEIELVLPGIVILENQGVIFAISLCDIESIQLPVV